MRFCVFASGSNANCTFVESAGTRLLIDCGLSCRQIEKKLASLNVSPQTLNAILITHEHIDHIRGLAVLAQKYQIPVYVSEKIIQYLPSLPQVHYLDCDVFALQDLQVECLNTSHDAFDPKAFILSDGLYRFAQVTDLGFVSKEIKQALSGVNALVLESNYDEQALANCRYPQSLKRRISSNTGHLSNVAAAQLAKELFHPDLYVLILAHLSINANAVDVALNCFQQCLTQQISDAHPAFELLCAPRYDATKLFDLSGAFELKIAAGL